MSGWSVAELLACVAPFGTAFVLAASQRGLQTARQVGEHISLVMPIAIVAVLWWALPVFTTVHWLVGRARGRAVPPSMPMTRVCAAAVMVGLTLLAYGWARQQPGVADPFSPAREQIDLQRMWLLLLGGVVGLTGCWSRQGAHRLLFDRSTERALFVVMLTLASVPVVVGAVAAFTPYVLIGARSWVYSESLPLSAQLPIVVGGILAITLRRSGQLRGGAFALTIGLAATACVHVLGQISYRGWSTAVYGCLLGGGLIGMIAVAGTARPKALRPSWS